MAQGKPGAPTVVQLQDDVRKIGALLASGFSLDDIRQEMKLTRRQLFARLAMLRKRARDVKDLWPKYVAKAEARYRQYEGIRQRAIQQNKLDTALRAIESMSRLDQLLVETGQALGVYEKAAEKHVHVVESPTLGMFHRDEPEAIEAEFSTDEEQKLIS